MDDGEAFLLATFSQRSLSLSSVLEPCTVTDTAIEINPFVKLSTSLFIVFFTFKGLTQG